ncbi:energy transducer TonB [Croceicoccus hydrothermalis]|uniref:energy transducer TonB n=1 Tax=Croceicoccus hydrothermalis TaxID=2867964 RepID=UPI001EFA65B5|nr:energy transducer TonB [Croceicoccus hydrothermalis]
MKRSLAITAVAMAVTAQPAAARDPLVLRPTEPWTMNYGEDSCQLVRIFGEGEDETALMLEQFGPSEYVRMTLIGEHAGMGGMGYPAYPIDRAASNGNQVPRLRVRFGRKGTFFTPEFKSAELDDGRFVTMLSAMRLALAERSDTGEDETAPYRMPELSVETFAALDRIEFDPAEGRNLIFGTGPMGGAAKAMNACMADLVTHWGLDLETQRTLRHGPVPRSPVSGWLTPRDYPEQAVLHALEGQVAFRLIVDEQGKPSACHVQFATGPDDSFSEAVCERITQEADFEPAIDAEGRPVPSFFTRLVNFRLRTRR